MKEATERNGVFCGYGRGSSRSGDKCWTMLTTQNI